MEMKMEYDRPWKSRLGQCFFLRTMRPAIVTSGHHPFHKLTLKTPFFQIWQCYSIFNDSEVVKVDINSLEKAFFTKLWDQTFWEKKTQAIAGLSSAWTWCPCWTWPWWTWPPRWTCSAPIAALHTWKQFYQSKSFSKSFAFNYSQNNKSALAMSHLLVIFHCGHLRESSFAKFTAVRLLPSVTSHVALQAGGLERILRRGNMFFLWVKEVCWQSHGHHDVMICFNGNY